VSRFLLDTNIISDVIRPRPSPHVVAWLERQLNAELFISAFTVAEIRRGILEKEPGKKRAALERWFSGPEGPHAVFLNRVLPFDERAAAEWARIMADGTAAGRPRSAVDMLIAATASAHRCSLVTLNRRHFEGVIELVDLGPTPR
jgi:predicted nucleic acid-binding protein